MEKFNIQEYIKDPSRKVVTRNGKAVRILCTDAKTDRPIIGLVTFDDKELVYDFMGDGKWSDRNEEDNFDLFFAPANREGFVNVYYRNNKYFTGEVVHNTEEAAKCLGSPLRDYVATVRITWEE